MFHDGLLQCLLLITAVLLLPANAFWWAPPTAAPTTESPLALKEIPLTYFRTYTYQPIAGHPFAAFPYYHHAASALQSPLLAGPARYEHGTYMHGSVYPMSVALPQKQQQSALPQVYQLPQTPVLHVKPLPSPTTTTTSTTSTEPPTTTSTTTTTTTTTTTPPPPSSTTASSTTSTTTSASVSQATEAQAHTQQPAQQQPQPQPQPQPYPYPYPTYNRRAYMGYNPHSYRPAYPYPDYTVYKTAPVSRYNSHGGQIQFVPCMCPVSVGESGVVRRTLTQEGRTNSDEEEDLMAFARADELNLPVEQSVNTDKTKLEAAEVDQSKSETEETVKTGAESEITASLLQKTTDSLNDQLSTNKVDEEESSDAVEQQSDVKQIEA